MRIALTGVFVSDQDEALRFYTETLGFVKKHDVPVGEFKWLTVVSPDDPDGIELLLEPNRQPGGAGISEGDVRTRHPSGVLQRYGHSCRV